MFLTLLYLFDFMVSFLIFAILINFLIWKLVELKQIDNLNK